MATKQSASKRFRLYFVRFFHNRFEGFLATPKAISAASKDTRIPSTPSPLRGRLPAMPAAQPTPFKAYDLKRKHLHTIEGAGGKPPPKKTSIHRITPSDFAKTKIEDSRRRSSRISKKKPAKAVSPTAANILRCHDGWAACTQCGKTVDDPACSTKCYTAFRKANNADDLIEIKGPGKHGYGAYTKPGVYFTKGQWLGEYVGQLIPLDVYSGSLYRFEIPGACAIDAEPCGNWTRFVNSSCLPNVGAFTDTIGKRYCVFFQALKDIGPETELTFNYGSGYFAAAGFKCKCPAMKRAHVPNEHKKAAKERSKAGKA